MEIVQLLQLLAEQQKMIGSVEDPLDQIVNDTLLQTELLSDDELEDVQAAALPYMPQKKDKD